MNRIIFIIGLCFFAGLMNGCKKDSGPDYYVSMKAGNQNYVFADSIYATRQAGQPVLVLYAKSITSGHLQVLCSDANTGLYINSYDAAVQKKIFQFTTNLIVGIQNGNPVYKTLLRPDTSVQNSISMNITVVTERYIEGNFSGNVTDGVSLTMISNGSFRAPFR